jgi:hypothetical protein
MSEVLYNFHTDINYFFDTSQRVQTEDFVLVLNQCRGVQAYLVGIADSLPDHTHEIAGFPVYVKIYDYIIL